jgi:hypothetical protein
MSASPRFLRLLNAYVVRYPDSEVKLALNRSSMEGWSQSSEHRVQLERCAEERERE